MNNSRRKTILAVASGGGHWEQLMTLRKSFEGCDVTFCTTNEGLLRKYEIEGGAVVPDCSRDSIFLSIKCLFSTFALVMKSRPDVIISTGAAPGFFCILAGRILGKRTVWIDSVANVEELSLSGRMAGKIATLWLTQWEHLARPSGPFYYGAVL